MGMKSTSPDVTYDVTVSAHDNKCRALLYRSVRAGRCGPAGTLDLPDKFDLDEVDRWLGQLGFQRSSGWKFYKGVSGSVSADVEPIDVGKALTCAGGGVDVTIDGVQVGDDQIRNEVAIPSPFATDFNKLAVALDYARIYSGHGMTASVANELNAAAEYADALAATCRQYTFKAQGKEAVNA